MFQFEQGGAKLSRIGGRFVMLIKKALTSRSCVYQHSNAPAGQLRRKQL
jgi:hypothetical protein